MELHQAEHASSCIEAQGYGTKCATISGYSVGSKRMRSAGLSTAKERSQGTFPPAPTLSVDNLRVLRKYIRKMRTSPILTALFPAVRQEILAATLLSPERSWYLSELAAHLKTSPSSLQPELEALARCKRHLAKEARRPSYLLQSRNCFPRLRGTARLVFENGRGGSSAASRARWIWAQDHVGRYLRLDCPRSGARAKRHRSADCWPGEYAGAPPQVAASRAAIRPRGQRNAIFGRRIPRQAAQRESLSQFHSRKQSDHDRGVPR